MQYNYYNDQIHARVQLRSRKGTSRISYYIVDGELRILVPPGYKEMFCPNLPGDIVEHVKTLLKKETEERDDEHLIRPNIRIETARCGILLHYDNSIHKNYVLRSLRRDTEGQIVISLAISEKFEDPLSPPSQKLFRECIREGLKYLLKNECNMFFKGLCEKYDFDFNNLKFSSAAARWGSCSSGGIINLSGILAILPDSLIEYIFVHEICHLKCMNHGKDFKSLYHSYYPDYEKYDRQIEEYLKRYGYLIRK